jgi:hypothetical protein
MALNWVSIRMRAERSAVRRRHARRIGAEFERDQPEESLAPDIVELQVSLRQRRGAGAGGNLAALGLGAFAQLPAPVVDLLRPRARRTAGADYRAQALDQAFNHGGRPGLVRRAGVLGSFRMAQSWGITHHSGRRDAVKLRRNNQSGSNCEKSSIAG